MPNSQIIQKVALSTATIKGRLFSRAWPRIPKTQIAEKLSSSKNVYSFNLDLCFLRTAGSSLITFALDIEKVRWYEKQGPKNEKPTLKSHQAWNGPVCWISLWGLTKFRIHLILWLYAHSFSSSSHQINSRLTTFLSWRRVTVEKCDIFINFEKCGDY